VCKARRPAKPAPITTTSASFIASVFCIAVLFPP
jgi:hypothetical protein